MATDIFELEIVNRTESKTIQIFWVEVESPTGNFVIGPDHTPLVSLLKHQGTLTYKDFAGNKEAIDTYKGGLFVVEDNKALVML